MSMKGQFYFELGVCMINTYLIWSPFSSLPTPEKSILQMMRSHIYFLNESIYLAVLGLIRGMQDLLYTLQLVESFSCHARSLVAACGIFSPKILQLHPRHNIFDWLVLFQELRNGE